MPPRVEVDFDPLSLGVGHRDTRPVAAPGGRFGRARVRGEPGSIWLHRNPHAKERSVHSGIPSPYSGAILPAMTGPEESKPFFSEPAGKR